MPQPERLQPVFFADMQQIFSVGREPGQEDMSAVRQILDLDFFKRQVPRALHQRVDAECGGDKQQENSSQHEACAELVLAGGGDQHGAARRRTRWLGRLGGRRGQLRPDSTRGRRNGSDLAGIDLPLQACKIGAQFRGDLVAHLAIFFEGFVENARELGGDVGIQGDRSHRSAVQDVVEDHRAGGARERLPAGDQLIEDAAQREEVAARVEFLATGLFGRHVGDGADGGAGAGEKQSLRIDEGLAAKVSMVLRQELGEAKIENFDGAAPGDENVGGFDVAVDDAFFVGGVEGVGQLDADVDRARNREGTEGDQFVEGLPFEQLHGDEGPASVFFDGVNDANAGMIERGGSAGFTEEAFESLRIAVGVLREEFQGYAAAEFGVFSFVDNAHPALTKLAEDAVVGDGFVEHERGAK